MNRLPLLVWYSKTGDDKRVKALMYDCHNGYAAIALESGRFVFDHIEYVTLYDASGVFEQYEWMDGEDE